MSALLQMPKLGLTMTEGIVAQWLVPAGQPFRKGQPLYVLETEKVANEIEADHDGVLEAWLVAEGDTVPVGAAIARIASAAGAAVVEAARGGAAKPRIRLVPVVRDWQPAAPPPSTALRAGRVIASPYARRLARDAGLDISTVTTARARITAEDVRRALARPPGT